MNTSYFFQTAGTTSIYRIEVSSADVEKTLVRLAPGDYLIGQGTLDKTRRVFTLNSIEFVAFHRLLGPWISGSTSMVFKNISTIEVKTLSGAHVEMKYSITPADDDTWVIFLSDGQTSYVANLAMGPSMTINGQSTLRRIELKFVENESGQILRTIKLERP